MKVLLDENIDIRFKRAFAESIHEIYTVRDMGWNGISNGQLLQKMSEAGFEALLAVDKNLPYQQNQDHLTVSVFILDVQRNVLANLIPFVSKLLDIWEKGPETRFYIVSLGD
ncbi:MAG: hypothetical protein NW226_05275 [Microscillaceae bacterium]|nr:hypothetical protein [Microscillaceae bacterium]